MPTGLHSLLVGGIGYWQHTSIVCGRAQTARSTCITEASNHDEGRGQKECNRSARECNGGIKVPRGATKCNWRHGSATGGHEGHGQKCNSRSWSCSWG